MKKFVDWFNVHKSNHIKKSMLRPVRERAGLGKPPVAFTTNAVLKRKVNYKRNELPVFLEKIKELIREQDSEIEKAVIDHGKYMINPEFKRFSKTEEEWFTTMKEGDRIRHLQRFSSFKVPDMSISFTALPTGSATDGTKNDRVPLDLSRNHNFAPGFTCSSSGQDPGRGFGQCSDLNSSQSTSGSSSSHHSVHNSNLSSGHGSLHNSNSALSLGHTSAFGSRRTSGHNTFLHGSSHSSKQPSSWH